jgi:hypothetical protein
MLPIYLNGGKSCLLVQQRDLLHYLPKNILSEARKREYAPVVVRLSNGEVLRLFDNEILNNLPTGILDQARQAGAAYVLGQLRARK